MDLLNVAIYRHKKEVGQGRSQAIFGGTHKASPTLSQGKGNIITVIITITVRKPFYYFFGILVLT